MMDALESLDIAGRVAPPEASVVDAVVELVLGEACPPAGPAKVAPRTQSRRRRRSRSYLVGAAAAVAAAGITVALALGGGRRVAPKTTGAGTVVQLASYRLELPGRYQVGTGATIACAHPFAAFHAPPGEAGEVQSPVYARAVDTTARGAGGCLFILLAPPYAPTTTGSDPEVAVPGARVVQVGRFEGRVASGSFGEHVKGASAETETMLYVELPRPDGQVQDLVVGADGLPPSELESLIANGLLLAGSSATNGTPIPAARAAARAAVRGTEPAGNPGAR
jgi:hypothetical protein